MPNISSKTPPMAIQLTVFYRPDETAGDTYEFYAESDGAVTQLTAATLQEVRAAALKLINSWGQEAHTSFDDGVLM